MIRALKEYQQKSGFMKYFLNTSWMFVEQGLKLFTVIIVGIYIARYLGPEKFGLLSYVLAIVTIFMSLSRLGMESILVRELIVHPAKRLQYIGTAHSLMLIAAIVCFVFIAVLMSLFESDVQIKFYVFIISIGMVFQTSLVIDYAFQSQVKAKFPSIAKSVALTLSALVKISLVYMQLDMMFLVISYLLDQILIALLLMLLYLSKKQPNFLFVFNVQLVRPLLKSAWPMVMSTVAIILYMRVDQIMIKNMLGSEQLGLYAAMTRIYEGWVIVPVILCASLLPAIIKSKSLLREEYEKRLSLLFSLVFWASIGAAVITTFFSEVIVKFTFGVEYVQASSVFVIIMWSAAFAALGSVTLRYFVAESMEKKIAIRTIIALIINIFLNLVLIPIYGIEGAAIATLVCLIVANYLIDYLDKELGTLVRIKNRAIFFGLYPNIKKSET